MSTDPWLREERAELAAQQILDAAGELFAERGVRSVGMSDVATAAGCSRATLYRYFDNRDALRVAFVHRETRRIGAQVVREIADLTDPADRLVRATEASLRMVRADRTLLAWFTTDDAGTTASIAQSSMVIEGLVATFIGDCADALVRRRARWVVRVLVSLLVDPEPDPDEEHALIEELVVPTVLKGR